MVEKHSQKYTLVWRVESLGQKIKTGEIKIDMNHYRNVKRMAHEKGYRSHGTIPDKGIRYDHGMIHALCLYLNDEQKTITAEGLTSSILQEIGVDFGLPLYRAQ